MSRHQAARHGEGTAWIIADFERGDYLCYWYAGRYDSQLAEHARVATDTEAVAWGRTRTSRVRIRMTDALTYWAGTTPRPAAFSHTWSDSDATDAPHSPPGDDPEAIGTKPTGRHGGAVGIPDRRVA